MSRVRSSVVRSHAQDDRSHRRLSTPGLAHEEHLIISSRWPACSAPPVARTFRLAVFDMMGDGALSGFAVWGQTCCVGCRSYEWSCRRVLLVLVQLMSISMIFGCRGSCPTLSEPRCSSSTTSVRESSGGGRISRLQAAVAANVHVSVDYVTFSLNTRCRSLAPALHA